MMTKEFMKEMIEDMARVTYESSLENLDKSQPTYDWMCRMFKNEFGFSADSSLPLYLDTLDEKWLNELYEMWQNNCEVRFKIKNNCVHFVATPHNMKTMLFNLERYYNLGLSSEYEKIKQTSFKEFKTYNFDKFTMRFFKNGNVRLKLV